MAIEVTSERAVCSKCGTSFSRHKGYFPVSYAALHKGIGHIPVCKDCIDNMYNSYLSQCNDAELAVRQMCRKLDLFWSKNVFEVVARKSATQTMMTQYIAKINTVTYAGKSYDDTLAAEGMLWNFGASSSAAQGAIIADPQEENSEPEEEQDIPYEFVAYWGSGYTLAMYEELERRKTYYMSKLDPGADLDIGTEALIRQACNLEVTIARDSAAGKSIDKSVNALNTVLGSLNFKPVQKKQDEADAELSATPLGVWLYRYENERPLPEIDEELKDVNKIRKYIFIWMGHLCKMLGKENAYSKMYEDEIARLRVEKPEYDGDDEAFMTEVMTSEDDEE